MTRCSGLRPLSAFLLFERDMHIPLQRPHSSCGGIYDQPSDESAKDEVPTQVPPINTTGYLRLYRPVARMLEGHKVVLALPESRTSVEYYCSRSRVGIHGDFTPIYHSDLYSLRIRAEADWVLGLAYDRGTCGENQACPPLCVPMNRRPPGTPFILGKYRPWFWIWNTRSGDDSRTA